MGGSVESLRRIYRRYCRRRVPEQYPLQSQIPPPPNGLEENTTIIALQKERFFSFADCLIY